MPLFKTIRYSTRLLRGIIKKHYKFIFLGLLIGALLPFAGRQISKILPHGPVSRSIGLLGTFSPSTLPQEVTDFLSIGLTKAAGDGSALPALATEWTADDELKTFTFKLDNSRMWHDKTRLKSSDLSFAFKDVEITSPTDDTIQFKLKDSYAPFPLTVSKPVFKKNFIGAGDYRLKHIKVSGNHVLSLQLAPLIKTLPEITFRFYSTEAQALTAFQLGEIKEIWDLNTPPGSEIWPQVKITTNPRLDRYVTLIINTQKDPFTDKDIRQAIAYAINKAEYNYRATGPISPASWAYNSNTKPYAQDLEKSKSLIKKAELKNPLKLEIAVFSFLLDTAEQIKKDLFLAGIEASIKVINSVPEEFDTFLAAQKIPPDPDQYSLWHSTQPTNLSGLKNPKIDKLLEDGRKTKDRQQIYLDFQRFLVEESPAVFLYHPVSYSISR